jgi:hypothetical protein
MHAELSAVTGTIRVWWRVASNSCCIRCESASHYGHASLLGWMCCLCQHQLQDTKNRCDNYAHCRQCCTDIPTHPHTEFTHTSQDKKNRRADKRLEGDEDDIDALLQKFALEVRAAWVAAAAPTYCAVLWQASLSKMQVLHSCLLPVDSPCSLVQRSSPSPPSQRCLAHPCCHGLCAAQHHRAPSLPHANPCYRAFCVPLSCCLVPPPCLVPCSLAGEDPEIICILNATACACLYLNRSFPAPHNPTPPPTPAYPFTHCAC